MGAQIALSRSVYKKARSSERGPVSVGKKIAKGANTRPEHGGPKGETSEARSTAGVRETPLSGLSSNLTEQPLIKQNAAQQDQRLSGSMQPTPQYLNSQIEQEDRKSKSDKGGQEKEAQNKLIREARVEDALGGSESFNKAEGSDSHTPSSHEK